MAAETGITGYDPQGGLCAGRDSNCVLALTLGLALVVHLLVILGVRIKAPTPGQRTISTVEVVIVRQPKSSQALPDKVSAAAKVTRGGSGDGQRDATTLPQESEGLPDPVRAGIATLDLDQSEPAPEAIPDPSPDPVREPTPDSVSEEALVSPEPMHPDTEVLTAGVHRSDSLTLARQPAKPQGSTPPVTATQILASRNQELAHLASREEDRTSVFANRPRRKAISSSTREYKYATYLEGWRRKVEQVGNLNYPDEARRKHLYGNLILRVAVRANGSVEQVQVLRSSGFSVLDQAAIHIVELSAPFAPFPADIRADTDVLDITRTWQFQRNNQIGWGN